MPEIFGTVTTDPISPGNRPREARRIPQLYITGLLERVVHLAGRSIQSGSISERALARKAHISQPHLHNVLKGIRSLSPETADRLMEALDVTVPQVLWTGANEIASRIQAVPLLRNRIGPGSDASFQDFRGYMPFTAALAAYLIDPRSAYLAADLALPAEFRAGDLILLDQNKSLRTIPSVPSCWVVAEGAGLRVRYVRRVRGALEASTGPDASGLWDWHTIEFHGRSILEIVRARIVWIGREMETPLAGSAGPARSRN